MEKEKMRIGFLSRSYVTPRAESVKLSNEGLLLSASSVEGNTEDFIIIGGGWTPEETPSGGGGL